MTDLIHISATVIISVIASSGFWSFVSKKQDFNDSKTRLMLGLAHDRIVHLGMTYIQRGWISKAEFEDFYKYLYHPYSTFGGNGLAEKVWQEVKALPIRKG